MKYTELKEGQMFNFLVNHPKEDIFLKVYGGFVRIPNKFTDVNHNTGKFLDLSDLNDVYILTKKEIIKNIKLTKGKENAKS